MVTRTKRHTAKQKTKRVAKRIRKPKQKPATAIRGTFRAVVYTPSNLILELTALDGVAAILRQNSRVKPFPDPVTLEMSLAKDFRLAPIGKERLAPDLSALRGALGNSGMVDPSDARASQSVGNFVELVS